MLDFRTLVITELGMKPSHILLFCWRAAHDDEDATSAFYSFIEILTCGAPDPIHRVFYMYMCSPQSALLPADSPPTHLRLLRRGLKAALFLSCVVFD